MEEYQSLKFAALFHDIGKFYQRATNFNHCYANKYKNLDKNDYGQNGAHSKWSADFVSNFYDDLVENLVLYHHNPKKDNSKNYDLSKIVQIADHHSSKERLESDEKQNVISTPLISIFSQISLDDKKSDEHYIRPIKLELNNDLYPVKNDKSKNWKMSKLYQNLWENFKNEFKLVNHNDIETVLAVVKKYTSTIPSAPYVSKSDISLYDHLKTTTAIANCRYLYSKEENLNQTDTQDVYKIINGDISGIQNFIYKVSSPDKAQNNMNKRLRGRSLYISLLTEAIASKLIIDLDLDSSNILFCGGGRFTIIAPNTNKTDKVLREIDIGVNDFFIEHFNAELYLAMVSINSSGKELGNFGKILSNLNAFLNENKKHKFINHLDKLFEENNEINYYLCPVCGNPSKKDELCYDCKEHKHLGEVVANAKYLIKYESDTKIPNSLFFSNLGIGFSFKNTENQVVKFIEENPNVIFVVNKLNDTNFLDIAGIISNKNVSFNFKVIGNSIPHLGKNVLYFNHLAEISKGANKLGILKMDVDNLGKIFSKGFHNLYDDKEGSSISRISSLSFYMDLFFSGKINQIVEKFQVYPDTLGYDELFEKPTELTFERIDDDKKILKKKTVYKPKGELPDEFIGLGTSTIHINYSGGDDLLVVGPYDDIIEFAQEFRTRFKEWTGYNNSINISGGIIITGPKFPIGKAALMADDELEKSKDCGRDKITVFNQVLSWENTGQIVGFKEIFEFGKTLEKLREENKLSAGFVYSLMHIWEKSNDLGELLDYNADAWIKYNLSKASCGTYMPRFVYKLRLIKKELKKDLTENGRKFMPWIKIPVSWSSLRLR